MRHKANLPHATNHVRSGKPSLEVLENWLAPPRRQPLRSIFTALGLAGKSIFVYAGNMGVAQNLDVVETWRLRSKTPEDIAFLLVGRGSDVQRLTTLVAERQPRNVTFHPEAEPERIPGLLAARDVGLVILDPRHKTHNVPGAGKFLA